MTNFAILRMGKIKSLEALKRGLKHVYREGVTLNADETRKDENTPLVSRSTDEAAKRLAERLPEKRRKDAVLAIEYLVTASPEAMQAMSEEERYQYFNRAWKWLLSKHGTENVIGGAVHRDETTEHMHVFVVPRVGDRLSAKEFMGGPKQLAQVQDDFAQKVGVPSGLQRGARRSGRTHTSIRTWYEGQNTQEDALEAAMDTIKELGRDACLLYAKKYGERRAERLKEPEPEPELAVNDPWSSYQGGYDRY